MEEGDQEGKGAWGARAPTVTQPWWPSASSDMAFSARRLVFLWSLGGRGRASVQPEDVSDPGDSQNLFMCGWGKSVEVV